MSILVKKAFESNDPADIRSDVSHAAQDESVSSAEMKVAARQIEAGAKAEATLEWQNNATQVSLELSAASEHLNSPEYGSASSILAGVALTLDSVNGEVSAGVDLSFALTNTQNSPEKPEGNATEWTDSLVIAAHVLQESSDPTLNSAGLSAQLLVNFAHQVSVQKKKEAQEKTPEGEEPQEPEDPTQQDWSLGISLAFASSLADNTTPGARMQVGLDLGWLSLNLDEDGMQLGFTVGGLSVDLDLQEGTF